VAVSSAIRSGETIHRGATLEMNNAHFKQFAQESEPSIELKHGNSPTSSPSSEEASTSSGNDGLLQMEEGDGGDTGAAVLLKAHGLGKFALPLNEVRRLSLRLEYCPPFLHVRIAVVASQLKMRVRRKCSLS